MDLKGKKIGIFGLGLSGKATLKFLTKGPGRNLGVGEIILVNQGEVSSWAKEIPPGVIAYSEDREPEKASSEFSLCHMIILSPGISRAHPLLRESLQKGVPLWSEIELAFSFFKAPIIAVTGTNGKTTTVSLLGEIFKKFGRRVFVGGNIGLPFIEAIEAPYDMALLELSSFQLESIAHFRPHIAAILNVFPNHGERYDNVESYRLAKWQIALNQKGEDILLIGEGVGEPPFPLQVPLLKQGEKGRKGEKGENAELRELYDFSLGKLRGPHNRKNIWFAWKIFKAFLGEDYDERAQEFFIKEVLKFPGVEHRLEYCGRWMNYEIYNDAKSTNWQATYTAVKAIRERALPLTLLVGGQLRGHNDILSGEGLQFLRDNTERIFAVGESGKFLSQRYGDDFIYRKDFWEVRESLKDSSESGVLLLSPGFPSFDQFSSYGERGKVFKKIFKSS